LTEASKIEDSPKHLFRDENFRGGIIIFLYWSLRAKVSQTHFDEAEPRHTPDGLRNFGRRGEFEKVLFSLENPKKKKWREECTVLS
jgi:hypothetical protein